MVCRNPLPAEDRARTRRELLAVTEERLGRIARRVEAVRLKDRDKIAAAVTRNLVRLPAHPEIAPVHVVTTPDSLQSELLRLAGVEVTAERRQKDQA